MPEDFNTGPSPICSTKQFSIHVDGDTEFARWYHPLFFDWREVQQISGTLVKDEEGDFSLVTFKNGDCAVVSDSAKHLARVWKDFVLNYKP